MYKYYSVMAFIYLVAQQPLVEEEIIAAIPPPVELHANGYYKHESHCLCNYIDDSSSGFWYKLKTCTCYGY